MYNNMRKYIYMAPETEEVRLGIEQGFLVNTTVTMGAGETLEESGEIDWEWGNAS